MLNVIRVRPTISRFVMIAPCSIANHGGLAILSNANMSSMAELTRLGSTVGLSELNDVLAADGCAIVEDILTADVVQRLNADFDNAVAATDPGAPNEHRDDIKQFFGKRTIRVDGLPAKSKTFHDVMCHPLLLGVADHFLLPNCDRYILNAAQLIEIGPGQSAQVIHRDENIWNRMEKPHPRLEIEAMFALTDFTQATGGTRAVPGSNHWPAEREPQEAEIQSAEMRAGSALFYLGNTLHGGGSNETKDARRRGLFAGYCLGWLRTEENFFLSVPLDAVREMSERVQGLLGYEQHFGLGAVEIGSPMNLLKQAPHRPPGMAEMQVMQEQLPANPSPEGEGL